MDNFSDKPKPDKVFDTLFTTNHLQMFKILLPYLSCTLQAQLAVYIKYEELVYTVHYLTKHKNAIFEETNSMDIDALVESLKPYCSFVEKSALENIKNMIANLKNAKEMMDMLTMIKEMFPEGMPFSMDGNGSNDDKSANQDSDTTFDLRNFLPDNVKDILNMLGNK